MKVKLNELDGDVDAVAEPPPRKRACTRKESTQKKAKGKENQTPQSAKRKANKQRRILLLGALPHNQSKLPGTSTDSPNNQSILKISHQPQQILRKNTQSLDQLSAPADHQKEHSHCQDQPSASADPQKNTQSLRTCHQAMHHLSHQAQDKRNQHRLKTSC